MKTKLFYLATLIILQSSCSHKDKNGYEINWQEIPVSTALSSNCNCTLKEINHYEDLQVGIFLASDSVTYHNDVITALIFDNKDSLCYLVLKSYDMISTCTICNYPIELAKLDFKQNGPNQAKLSGVSYESCSPSPNPTNITNENFVLTKIYVSK